MKREELELLERWIDDKIRTALADHRECNHSEEWLGSIEDHKLREEVFNCFCPNDTDDG